MYGAFVVWVWCFFRGTAAFPISAIKSRGSVHGRGCIRDGRKVLLSASVGTERPHVTHVDAIGRRRKPSASLHTSNFDMIAVKRAVDIVSIIISDIVAPLVTSLLPWSSSPDGYPSDWNQIWSRTTPFSTVNGTEIRLSNAERVVLALERLGCTYVKFGQALSSRPDVIPEPLADALCKLQDQMEPFDSKVAKEIIRAELNETGNIKSDDLASLMESLSGPVAAASIGQVHKGFMPGYGYVAIKVRRPGIHEIVELDATLLRLLAIWVESIPGFGGRRQLVRTKIIDAVDEFMSRVYEELDYQNEATNVQTFSELYGRGNSKSDTVNVVVPELLEGLCTDNVIVMEWIDGSKLTEVDNDDEKALMENLALVETGIECTLSQLLTTGIMHADPHAGNLLKVKDEASGEVKLGYLDFGVLSSIPSSVRDGLVCAVVQLVFARDVEAVAQMFTELQLLPASVLRDPGRKNALTVALQDTFDRVLQYENPIPGQSRLKRDGTSVPILRFDNLLGSLSRLVADFEFKLPPYFLNNARALGTLEGIARSLDPSFNVLRVVYPYALNRLLQNPSGSPVVEETLLSLVRNQQTGSIDRQKLNRLLDDSATLTGYSRRRVIKDVLKTKGGKAFIAKVVVDLAKEEYEGRRRTLSPRKAYFRL